MDTLWLCGFVFCFSIGLWWRQSRLCILTFGYTIESLVPCTWFSCMCIVCDDVDGDKSSLLEGEEEEVIWTVGSAM